MTFDQPSHAEDPAHSNRLHVAVIMDGNGRWATNRGWPRLVGHRKGAERVRELVDACPDIGIKYLTLYAFSTENWKRSTEEVMGLMSLFARYVKREAGRMNREGVRLRVIGDRTRLDCKLRELFDWIERETAGNDRVHLTVAVNYGGRDEIRRATQAIARDVAAGKLEPENVSDATLSDYMDTHFLPDPDLVVRTSGETRVSNFLLWQSAYSEYVFTPVLWPDFTPQTMNTILQNFGQRERRFGGVLK
ncbi:polyprenyl diphosphate synthase [Roseinatronobacter bogoriensis]|uniref:Isoprenyl transferase n=1 Tax=Roseinatronobacter bogoriensis subsp. barguzinensis TaxID=441209 RepID=A0A2K8KF58_9RHOB|nr:MULTISPECIES: polyprenyl diphosphate synthase [Rhodobaca]ATX66593.1 di-trans,poly-cis-decaprenylcistransferase [Rhodobaca barguzinensis]MBB4207766.1 undecaprenyl diphosphate synthase [Rhodobaca bogoriensis DSM 18756]TDW39926.1 undecaprenyl diphosphate synthase [Rhodobaca barguzinensis]TDY70920.1 undecaprenyl pyrophosphate synthetase [Rhodobaca bogoriensis DSM 18756]